MKKEGYPKSVRIKKESEFKTTFLHGAKQKGESLIIFRLKRKDEGGPKFGIKVGKGIKKASERNKIKRVIKEVLRKNKERFNQNENVVVLCKYPGEELDLECLRDELKNLINGL